MTLAVDPGPLQVCDGAEISPVKTESDGSESASVFSGWAKTKQVGTVLLLLNQPVITEARSPANEQCPAASAAAAQARPGLQVLFVNHATSRHSRTVPACGDQSQFNLTSPNRS